MPGTANNGKTCPTMLAMHKESGQEMRINVSDFNEAEYEVPRKRLDADKGGSKAAAKKGGKGKDGDDSLTGEEKE